ncbi:DUF962-domain-containing protein [Ascodesmis nigricans]|uniref:DUF962-domain-containing protein n=1 Tax=Ascodesmis nigricans TaxID=341454 RepID=A0A4S2MZ09_9PEZI|nr:DUF962-domain-containing protein [Ascodesmis nigricans]
MAILDLEEQLVFYGSYHTHKHNITIHIIFVPILMFGLFLLSSSFALASNPYLNLSTLASLLYSSLYIAMEPVAGSIITPYIILQSLLGTYLHLQYGNDAVYWVGVSQIVAWGIQFVGHGVFEKKAPALLDNIVQALFLAPFFVWLEVLFMWGYRPELRDRVSKKVKTRRAEMDAKKGTDGVKKEL